MPSAHLYLIPNGGRVGTFVPLSETVHLRFGHLLICVSTRKEKVLNAFNLIVIY